MLYCGLPRQFAQPAACVLCLNALADGAKISDTVDVAQGIIRGLLKHVLSLNCMSVALTV